MAEWRVRYETFIALRYLRARRKQALISVISVVSTLGFTVGVAALVVALALMTGFREEIQGRILSTSAHLLVQPFGATSAEGALALALDIEKDSGVVAASPVFYPKGLLVSAARPEGSAVMLKAVFPEREARVTSVSERLTTGSMRALAPKEGAPPAIVLGASLADELGVAVGDRVRLVVPQATLSPLGAMPRTRSFEVAGTFESGYYIYDSGWGFVHMKEGEAIFEGESVAPIVEVRVKNPDRVEDVSARLEAALETPLRFTDWKELNRPLFSAFKVEKLLMFLAIGLIVVVASFNIVTTLVLMVMEKGRDIGILKAMGARAGSIGRIFVWQGLFTGAAGTALGAALGVALCVVFDTHQIIRLSEDVYFIPYVPFHVKAPDVLIVAATALAIALLATLHPSRQAAHLEVVDALKYE